MSRLLRRGGHGAMQAGIESLTFMQASAVTQGSGERWEYVSFSAWRLPAGGRFPFTFHEQETCVVVIGGGGTVATTTVDAGGAPSRHARWDIGARADPFGGPPAAAFIPAGTSVEIATETGIEFALGSAPARPGAEPRLLPAERARLEIRGSGATERRIHHILMEDEPAASLLVTEVVTPGGHWSSYPPHKHDTDDPPRESRLEEIYYFRFADPRGFGVVRVYTPDASLDETIAVRDGDLVLVPRGYHTFSAAAGYDAYYLNVMAGPRREWKVAFDPDHRWLLG